MSVTVFVQGVIAAAVGAGLVAGCRYLWRRSALCAGLVVAGLLVRAALTLFLFWASYLDLPALRQYHTGDGFWRLAIDATTYYPLAFAAAHNGLDTIAVGSPSPAFLKVLALWMRAVGGASPMSGAYLNLVLYVLLCVAIVAVFRPAGRWRTDLPCAVTLAAVSFSPVLVVYSSQPLKDMLVICLIGILCLGAFGFLPTLAPHRRSIAAALGAGAAFLAALYIVAGIRTYYGVLAWSALALVLGLFVWVGGFARFARQALVSVLFLAAGWLCYWKGAGIDYVNPYRPVLNAAWTFLRPAAPGKVPPIAPDAPPSIVTKIDDYRAGFVLTPGATSIQKKKKKTAASPSPPVTALPAQAPPAATPSPAATTAPVARPVSVAAPVTAPAPVPAPVPAAAPVPAPVPAAAPVTAPAPVPAAAPAAATESAPMDSVVPVGLSGKLSAATLGLGLIFVPVSLLKALSIVEFSGGRGLLAITDVDTLFMDLTIAAVILVLLRRRSAVRDRLPYVCFAATLAIVTSVLMAYIVTNYGTLFRLRLMAAAPIWLLPLALSNRIGREQDAEERDASIAARTRESFGYEWTHFHRWYDSSEVGFRDYFETVDLEALRGCRVLDAGCGMGRHARQMAAHARHVVAVDFSRAIEQAALNTRGMANVHCVKADLLQLPFAEGTFDYVYSLGVLHHLGNTETAVRALAAQLKPGGRLRVYLYWKRHGGAGAALRLVSAIRALTTRLPFWLLRWLCWLLSVALWVTVVVPYRLVVWAGVRDMSHWPLFVYAKYPFRVLYNDQFDRFSAPLEKRYDPEDVSALLESAGLRDVRVEARFGWIAEGVKPEEPRRA